MSNSFTTLDRPDLKLLSQIEELALGGQKAKKEMLVTHMFSSIGFISPVVMLSMAAIGATVISPVGLTVMGLMSIMTVRNAWEKHKSALYSAFFEPHDKLVAEFDKAIKPMVKTSKVLKKAYDAHMRNMYRDLKNVPEQPTKKDARLAYRKIYSKYMSEVLKSIKKHNIQMTDLRTRRFNKLVQSLKRARLLNA